MASISNSTSNSIIVGTSYDDFIENRGDSVTIDVAIGDDSIHSSGSNVPVLTKDENNTLNLAETIKLSAGNNTLTGNSQAQIYQYTGGNHVITNYSHENTIELKSGEIDSYSFDGGDLIFKIGKGTLTLQNMTNHAITIKDSSGKTTTKIYSNGYSPQEVIKNLVHAWNKSLLSDMAKLDESIKLSSHFNTIQEVIDQMVADCRDAGTSDTFLRKYCGIILDNDDTGAITGWDAGGASVKTAANVVDETLSTLKHVPDYTDTTFTAQNLTIHITSSGDTLTADGKKVLDGLYSWWADESLKPIEESYGFSFTDSDKINFALTPSANYWGQTSSYADTVTINMGPTYFYGNTDYNGNGVDRTIAHEFTHVTQHHFINDFYFPQFLQEGLADLTGGIDDMETPYIQTLAGNADRLASYLDINATGTGNIYYYAAGYMFYRYFAKQVSDAYDSLQSYAWEKGAFISGTSDADFLTSSGKGATITAGSGNDTITAYGENIQVFGESGNDYILTNGSFVKANGGDGDDTIKNRSNDVLISGNEDNDLLVNGEYWEKEHGGHRVSLSGGTGNDTLSSNGENSLLDGGDGSDKIYNGYSYYEPYNTYYTSQYADYKGNNSTVIGGAGNDDICNYGDNVLFLYRTGDGSDIINGFNSTSTLGISGDTYSTMTSGSNIIVKVGNEKITLSGAKSLSAVNIEHIKDKNPLDIQGTNGNDTIENTLDGATIQALAGDDEIYNEGSNVTINAGNGNDLIRNGDEENDLQGGSNVSINGGVGDDSIINVSGYYVTIDGGANNDSIRNYCSSEVTVNGGDGNDSITNYEISHVSINGGTGNDSIISEVSYETTIDGGTGNDSIISKESYVNIINGGNGSDYIEVSGEVNSINGGAGNDKISLSGSGNLIQYASGDGNDTIWGFTSDDTLKISDGYASTAKSGSDIIVTVDNEKIILKNAANLSILNIRDGDTIDNSTDGVAVNGTRGGDEITNSGNSVTINANAGNDVIYSDGNSVKIGGNAGSDIIYSDGDSVKIDGGDDNDDIEYNGKSNSINGGNGNDYISNSVRVSFGGGRVIVPISNVETLGSFTEGIKPIRFDNNSIDGGAGNDSIINYYSSNLSINGGDGNDLIRNTHVIYTWNEETQQYEKGISPDNTTINGGAGNDSIENYGSNVTITGGAGNDHISLSSESENTLIDYASGDGNDTVWGFNEDDTLKISGGSYSTQKSSSNIIVTVGNGKITLNGAASLDVVNIDGTEKISLDIRGTNGNDSIENTLDGATIQAFDGNDSIYNDGSSVSIDGGDGDDSILTYGGGSTIFGGAGNDTIVSNGDNIISGDTGNDYIEIEEDSTNITIDGGAGDDTIYGGEYASINGGNGKDSIYIYGIGNTISGDAGNDTIISEGSSNTISGGTGNDIISLSGDHYDDEWNLILYTAGDGNDTIWGIGEYDTLSISGGTYSTMARGNDIIFKVGNGSITLKDAREIDEEPVWTLKGTTATCKIDDETKITVKGVTSINGLTLSGDTIIVSAASLGTQKVTVSDGYTLVLDDDVKEAEVGEPEWSLKNTTATLSQKQSAGYVCNGGSITYSNRTATVTLATLTGVQSVDGLSVDDNVITLSEDALGSVAVKLTKGDYKLELDDSVITEPTSEPTWIISGNKATYKNGNSAYYSLASNGKSVNFVKAAADKKAKDLITLNGVNKNFSANDVEIDETNQVVTLSNNALNKKTVTIAGSENYSLALGDDVKEAEVEDAEWTLKKNTATLSQKQSVGYVCNGGSITYSSKSATVTLATLTGVQSVDGLYVDDNVITLSEEALGSATVKLTKGNYKLELDDSVVTEPTSEPTWFISGNKATYKDGNSAYYSLASNGKSVNFVKAAADKKAKDLITLNGINKNFSTNDVEIDADNQIVTLYDHALNKKTVTIGGSENYSLALGDDVKEATVSEPQWAIKKTTATLSQKQSVGYVCNGGSITYSSKSATAMLATLTGVQSVDGLYVDGNVITLSEDAIGSTTVKLTKGDYKLELDDSIATEPTTEPTWFISGNKATYKDGNSAYYSLASNGKSVNFVKAAADKKAKDLITLNGINKNFSADDVEIDADNMVVTLSNNALDKKNVTIGGSEDYSLALGDDVIEPELGYPKLEVKGSKATLTQSTSVGYLLTNDKTVTYSKKVSATTLATVTGVKSKSGISFDESSITLANSALTNKVTVSGDVSFEFAANYKNASITGSKDDDVISVLGTGVSVTGGKGDDYFTSGGGNTFIYASGDGDDVIADFTSNDRLKVTSGDFKVNTDGNDVIVSVTKGNVTGSITLSDAAGQFIAIIDSNNKGHHYFTSASDYWFDENSFDTDIQLNSLANFSETNNQIGAFANFNDMDNSLASFDYFSNKERHFATYCDKK